MDLDDDELKATRILLGLEKEGIEKNIKNLKEYIKEDDIYTRYKNGEYNELSDFEMFCINHCKDIEVVLGNLDALCDMQRTADIELKNARKINEEHQKENGLLREKIKQLEEENYVQKVALLENSIPKQKVKNRIKENKKLIDETYSEDIIQKLTDENEILEELLEDK